MTDAWSRLRVGRAHDGACCALAGRPIGITESSDILRRAAQSGAWITHGHRCKWVRAQVWMRLTRCQKDASRAPHCGRWRFSAAPLPSSRASWCNPSPSSTDGPTRPPRLEPEGDESHALLQPVLGREPRQRGGRRLPSHRTTSTLQGAWRTILSAVVPRNWPQTPE